MSIGISRKSFRNIWLLLLLLLMGMTGLMYQQAQDAKQAISSKDYELHNLRSELENASRRSAALEELDKLTIDERTATRLDILRHLGLEQSGYQFQVNARQVNMIGGSNLYLRVVALSAEIPYGRAMTLMDDLYDTQKIVISTVELRSPVEMGDKVRVMIEGTIYGLEKNGP